MCLSLTGKQCAGLGGSPSGLRNTLNNSENELVFPAGMNLEVHVSLVTSPHQPSELVYYSRVLPSVIRQELLMTTQSSFLWLSLFHRIYGCILTLGLGSRKVDSHAEQARIWGLLVTLLLKLNFDAIAM